MPDYTLTIHDGSGVEVCRTWVEEGDLRKVLNEAFWKAAGRDVKPELPYYLECQERFFVRVPSRVSGVRGFYEVPSAEAAAKVCVALHSREKGYASARNIIFSLADRQMVNTSKPSGPVISAVGIFLGSHSDRRSFLPPEVWKDLRAQLLKV